MISTIAERCDKADAYDGKEEPSCFANGDFCAACMKKQHEFIDASRPPMSPDLKEFFDYVCMSKRLLQIGRFKSDEIPANASHYEIMLQLERLIRTGGYRHALVMLRSILAEIADH